ncbi:TIGR02594 family protein [Rhodopseudomonas pseudopalustris]|uniref:TIGR02594 family protein n=1 Tax=Rhodopseudomonas pseudopalustris TaxID=1513892 RepID=UPI003F975535
MALYRAFRSPMLMTIALGSVVALATSPASARPRHHHHSHHHVSSHHHQHYAGHADQQFGNERLDRRSKARYRRASADGSSGWSDQQQGFAAGGFGGSNLVAEARRYLGGNPTGRSRLWCARFMNMVLERAGHRTSGSDMARSFASYGQRISGPQVGAIAVMSRGKRGGHVGVVSGIDANGNPIVVSGNHNRRVAEAVYPRSRVYAYVLPSS